MTKKIQLTARARTHQDEIWLQAANGYGSDAGNKIRRWTNVINNNPGASLQLVQSATAGDRIYIKQRGKYVITYTEVYNAVGGFGIRRNSTNDTIWIAGSPVATEVIAAETSGGNNHMSTATAALWMNPGDFVAANGDGTASGTFSPYAGFRVIRVA